MTIFEFKDEEKAAFIELLANIIQLVGSFADKYNCDRNSIFMFINLYLSGLRFK